NAPSSSATEELLSETYLADGRVRYVREDRPGLARAHNTGLLYARGDILAFTDDDVVVDRHWVEAIEETFDAAGKVGCVT
ncbi:MAG: glycosyltransferase family 2 protein, partial [Roseibium sp.]|nr:glycosyltransferase family 2 protein [Roseibium sp.]